MSERAVLANLDLLYAATLGVMLNASEVVVVEVIELRERLTLTQAQLASLLGVSQAAVSQYESGRRIPSGDVEAFYARVRSAVAAPVIVEHVGRRPTTMPAQRWERVIDPASVGPIVLPVRLDWSPRAAGSWDYNDEDHRRELYRIMIDAGDALDVITYTDPDELAQWADELLVSRAARNVLDRLVERIAATADV